MYATIKVIRANLIVSLNGGLMEAQSFKHIFIVNLNI